MSINIIYTYIFIWWIRVIDPTYCGIQLTYIDSNISYSNYLIENSVSFVLEYGIIALWFYHVNYERKVVHQFSMLKHLLLDVEAQWIWGPFHKGKSMFLHQLVLLTQPLNGIQRSSGFYPLLGHLILMKSYWVWNVKNNSRWKIRFFVPHGIQNF